MRHVKTTVIIGIVIGCGGCGSSQPTLRPIDQASRFIEALNAKNTGRMAEVAGTPFRFRNQSWQSAPDGGGFVLGEAQERVAEDSGQLDPLLRQLADNVAVETPEPVVDPPSQSDLLSEPLRGASPEWAALNLVLFRRGEGDVEHIAIVGVEPVSGKVVGLYVN
jgi:hypothetical protein